MIKFFRRIRQRLLQKNSYSKYLIYAIGEIILVVIGILIALQINNRNEWKKDRIKEEKILLQIEKNIEESIAIWERALRVIERSNDHYQIVLASRENKYPYHDSLQIHFSRGHWLGYNWTTGHSIASFEALKSQGFDIIVNDTLSNLIIDVFEKHISRVQNQFTQDFTSKAYNYEQYLTRNIHGLVADFSPKNYNALINDNYYYSILREFDGWRAGYIRRLNEMHIPEMQRTLRLINKELQKFK